jgi:hypothetical protein
MELNLTFVVLGIATCFDLPAVNCSIAAQHYAMSHTDRDTCFVLGIATCFDLPTVNCSIAAQHYAMSHTDRDTCW